MIEGKSQPLDTAGVTDIAFDPRDPDVLYACTHQRQRTVAALINGGPESGIFKSLDGGDSYDLLLGFVGVLSFGHAASQS